MADVKMTKAMYFAEVKAIVEASGAENTAELVEFLDHQVELLTSKAEKAKARQAAKKTEGDELRAVVESILTEEAQTIDAITAQIEGEDVTRAKVTARLTQLVKAGVAVKETMTEDKRKITAYRLAE
jgi:hypothetical protein